MWQRLVRTMVAGLLPLSLLTSCNSYAKFIDTLNERNVSSCVVWVGQFTAGTLWGGAVNVRGITVTGGADLPACQAAIAEDRL